MSADRLSTAVAKTIIQLLPRVVYCLVLGATAVPLMGAGGDPAATVDSSQPAPGTPGVFAMFGRNEDFASGPSINEAGLMAFSAYLQTGTNGIDETNNFGLWSNARGSLELLARKGDHAPGTPASFLFNFPLDPVMNSAGQSAFSAYLRGPDVINSNGEGIWHNLNGPVELLARASDVAPGTIGAKFYQFASPVINDSGRITFFASLYPGIGDTITGTGAGIWTYFHGELNLVVRSGNQAPDMPAGTSFFGINPPVMNSDGNIAFYADLRPAGTGINPDNSNGIWSSGRGSLALVAVSGMAAPGLEPGAKFATFVTNPVINKEGAIAFSADLHVGPGGVTTENAAGIWSDKSGQLDLVIRGGDSAPALRPGAKFSYFQAVDLNNSGDISFNAKLQPFVAGLDDPNDSGIWLKSGETLQLVAQEGSHAPGTPAGVVFEDLASGYTDASLNGRGRVAFAGILKSDGSLVTEANNDGIWAQDQNGVLRLIAREEDVIDVAPGPAEDLRTIASLHFNSVGNDDDGQSVSFNDAGQVAYFATFTDGSAAAILSNIATVPEPASVGLVYAGLLVASQLRPGRRRAADARQNVKNPHSLETNLRHRSTHVTALPLWQRKSQS
jgi:hypothetical protein